MGAILNKRHFFGVLGLAGFLLCAWFSYECGLNARHSASRAYTLWLSGTAAQNQAAARQNGLWVLALAASLLLGLVFLSACFVRRRVEVRHRGIGLLLLSGSCLPLAFSFTIISPLLNLGGRLAPGARVTTWSSGSVTLEGWQMYGGAAVFALTALAMIGGGAYLLLAPSSND